jgi:hypothetical protein
MTGPSTHMNSAADSDNPISLALRAIEHLDLFTQVVVVGLDWSEGLSEIDRALRRELPESSQRSRQKVQAFAIEQSAAGFTYLWQSTAVRIWSILETCVNDLFRKTGYLSLLCARN